MFGERHDPEFLKHLFEQTEILRKPITGIIAGYHVLPYILVGPQEEQPHRSVEIRGKIKVSPRLVLAPGRAGQTYGDLFKEHEVMDETLVARVFSFMYASRHQVTLESEDLNILRSDRNPQAQIERAMDELAQREVINTGVILAPNVRFYPVSSTASFRRSSTRNSGRNLARRRRLDLSRSPRPSDRGASPLNSLLLRHEFPEAVGGSLGGAPALEGRHLHAIPSGDPCRHGEALAVPQ